jgi:hypothetical protein
LAFVASVLLAWFGGWSTRDVVWGFWLASWIAGIAAVGLPWLRALLAIPDPRGWIAIGLVGGASVAFHAAVLGFFHFIYGHIMDGAVPLWGYEGRVYTGKLSWRGGTPFSLWPALAECVRRYWLFVLIVLVREAPALYRRPFGATENDLWKLIIRFHALVLLSVVIFLMGAESFAGYLIVLLILFSPPSLWRAVFRLERPPGG